MSDRYAIIGGGIAGASIAYHLGKKTDGQVTVYERQSLASETTFKSVAQFGYYGNKTQYRMKQYGMELYNEFFRNPYATPHYRFTGLLLAATEQAHAEELQGITTNDNNARATIERGLDRDLFQYIPGNELKKELLLPPVNEEAISGALFRPKVGYMTRPQELTYEFFERARNDGVEIKTGTTVQEVTTKQNRVRSITTDDGDVEQVDKVVCAAGPWNITLAESVGIELPLKHTLAPIIKLTPADTVPYDIPVINHYNSPYAFHRRREDELLIGYNPGYEDATRYDPSSMSERVPSDIREEAIELLAELIPGWLDAPATEEWVGVRSQTPDGNPIIGWTDIEGFSIAAFHSSGIQLAPAAGKIIAAQLVDGDPTSFYDALSISRFDGYNDHYHGDEDGQ